MVRSLLVSCILLSSLLSLGQSQAPQTLKLYYETEGNRVMLYGDSEVVYPQTVEIKLEFTGMKKRGKVPKYQVVPANSSKTLLAELEATGTADATFSYTYTYYFGDLVNASHDKDFAYRLPFEDDNSFKMTQGYDGKFSHQGKKALDFTMPEGTKIVAARSGLVARVKEDSDRGCANISCLDEANYITIIHEDGSHAQYFHLRKDGVEVEVGQNVESGDLIGFSGNTGFTSGPHLHFQVEVPHAKEPQSVGTKFLIQGKLQFLKEGNLYNSNN